jgi:hypothetical protein
VNIQRTEVSGNDRNGVWLLPGAQAQFANGTIAGNADAGISGETPEGAEPNGAAAQLLLADSTVADNAGGAVTFANGLAVTTGGSILAAPDGTGACTGDISTLTDAGYNLATDNTCGLKTSGDGTSLVDDPMLGALTDNGGDTATMLPGTTSPAVNAIPTGTSLGSGESAIVLCGEGAVDQIGTIRPQGSGCDIGAAERAHGLITVTASDATVYSDGSGPAPHVTPSYSGFAGTDTAADLDNPATCSYDQNAATTTCHGSCSYRSSWSTRNEKVGTGSTAATAAIPRTTGFGIFATSSRPIPRKKMRPPHPRQPQLKKRRQWLVRSSGSGGGAGIGRLTLRRVACSQEPVRGRQFAASRTSLHSKLRGQILRGGDRRLADVPLADVRRRAAVAERAILQQRDLGTFR